MECVLRQNEVWYWLYLMDFCRNFQRDGGWPTAFGMQVLTANHFVLLWWKQMSSGTTIESLPLGWQGMCQGDERKWTIDEASLAKLSSHIKTKVFHVSWDNSRGNLFTVCWVCGVKVAWTWHGLFGGTGEIGMECQGKMSRAVKRKAESTEVHVCGGLPCSSVEVSVMEMERRG